MACYTICDCLLSNLELDKKYITDVLMVFSQQTNSHKVALDKTNRILEIYSAIAESNHIIAVWLTLMSMKPSSFETIDIDVANELDIDELFLTVCSSTKGQQKAIVNTHERWTNHKYVSPRVMIYKSVILNIFDRDEAITELNQASANNITALNSVIATNQSTIQGTNNLTDGK